MEVKFPVLWYVHDAGLFLLKMGIFTIYHQNATMGAFLKALGLAILAYLASMISVERTVS